MKKYSVYYSTENYTSPIDNLDEFCTAEEYIYWMDPLDVEQMAGGWISISDDDGDLFSECEVVK